MKMGKLSESVMKRSVLKPLSKITAGSDRIVPLGIHGTAIQVPQGKQLVVTTDPVTTAFHHLSDLAVHAIVNDLVVTGAVPVAVLVTILLSPGTEECALKEMMEELARIAEKLGIQVAGVHTEVTDGVNRPILSLTGLGLIDEEPVHDKAEIQAGQQIVMTKGVGIEGTAILSWDREEKLRSRFPASFVKECKNFLEQISILPEARIAQTFGAVLYNVGEGGLYRALWELGEAGGLGLSVDFSRILIRQETVEVCELFDLDPFRLRSGGTLLAVTDRGEGLAQTLVEQGIPAAVIGELTKKKDRVILRGEERRFLERP